jgi:hypothetical protein
VPIRRLHLKRLLAPPHPGELTTMRHHASHGSHGQVTIRPFTHQEVARRWEPFKSLQALRAAQLRRRGGAPFDASWPLIRAAREKRERGLYIPR